MSKLILRGIETNNLNSVDVSIPYGQVTAVVGGSGAGKTSLAFHTLYALCKNELDTISGRTACCRPKVRGFENLLPAIALKQKNTNVNPRSSIFTYLGLDKLLLPLFLEQNQSIKRNIFVQNNPANYCPVCEGLGVVFQPDVKKIVDLEKPLSASPFLSWNHFLSAHYYPLLKAFCEARGIDMSKSIAELSDFEQKALLHEVSEESFSISYKQKNRYRNKRLPFVGAVQEIQECCNNLQSPGNRQKAKSYIAEQTCPECHGARFATYLKKYSLHGWTIQDIISSKFDALFPYLQTLPNYGFGVSKLKVVVKNLINNNLGYLSPMRSIPSLSGGEFQRLQLAAILSSSFSHLLYIFDEVSSSLHVAEYSSIINQLRALKKRNSTLVMVEHSLEFIEKADNLIALENGERVSSSDWTQQQQQTCIQRERLEPRGEMNFFVQGVHNIRDLDVKLPMGCLIGCCGLSGSGKSSFAEAISWRRDVDYIKQGTIQGNSNSTVATYLKLMQPIDAFLCKALNVPSKTFLFNNKKSQCPICGGKGYVDQIGAFDHTYRSVCESCGGRRYNSEVLEFRFDSVSIYQIMTMTVADLYHAGIFAESKAVADKLEDMIRIGLGHLTLFRPTSELSGGEAQRIKLLSRVKTNLKKTFLIIDEPASGLGRQDTKLLVEFLDKLLRKAKGIMVIEHNPFLLKNMDYFLEFGPRGGDDGGNIIFQGFFADMKCSKSIIKDYL